MVNMLEANAKISQRTITSKGHKYRQLLIYLPKALCDDSQFPFQPGQAVTIHINGEGLRIEPAK